MITIDVMTGYVVCGVGAFIAAAMLRFAVSAHRQSAAAMHLCAAAFLALGLGLTQAFFAGPQPGPASQLAMVVGTLVCLVLASAGLGRMAGAELPRPLLAALLAAAAVVPAVALGLGVPALARTFAVAMAVLSLLALGLVRDFLLAPPNLAARVLGLVMVGLAASCLARAGWTLAWDAAPLPHLLHVPAAMQSLFAVFYGVVPMLVAALLVDTVNAQLREELHDRATFDELTGVLTRRAVRDRALRRIAEARRSRLEVAVMMIDLDHFKAVNDLHGHRVGDTVLRETARALQLPLRQDALLARYGGEEFVALVPVADLAAAQRVAERLRAAVEYVSWPALTPLRTPVTASIGVALVGADASLDDVLERADAALYRAKREGRNRVCSDDRLPDLASRRHTATPAMTGVGKDRAFEPTHAQETEA